MALRPVYFDTVTGGLKAGGTPGAPTVSDFDVDVGGQSQFGIGSITSGTYIEVLINGAEKREGASHDYQRNTGASRIDFNFTVPQNAWVRIKVFP